MEACIILALLAIRRRDFASHGAWMIRGYAIGLGAGTQLLTHLPWFLLVDRKPGDSAEADWPSGVPPLQQMSRPAAFDFFRRRTAAPSRPIKPVPNRVIVAGSGVAVVWMMNSWALFEFALFTSVTT